MTTLTERNYFLEVSAHVLNKKIKIRFHFLQSTFEYSRIAMIHGNNYHRVTLASFFYFVFDFESFSTQIVEIYKEKTPYNYFEKSLKVLNSVTPCKT